MLAPHMMRAVLVIELSIGVVGHPTDGDCHVVVRVDLRERDDFKPERMRTSQKKF